VGRNEQKISDGEKKNSKKGVFILSRWKKKAGGTGRSGVSTRKTGRGRKMGDWGRVSV